MADPVHAGVTQRLLEYREHAMGQVLGWFEAESAEIIATLLAHQVASDVGGGVAEIGVHHGKSFLLLANGTRPGERAVALDVFGSQEKNVDNSGLGDRARFEANVAKFAPTAKVETVESSSLDVTRDAATDVFGEVRMMSIDGGHTAAVTAHDLGLAEACVVHDGIVVLDDVLNAHWLGVVTGLFQFLATSSGLVPFAYSPNKLYLAPSPLVAARYAEVLRQAQPDLLGKTGVEFCSQRLDVYGQGSPRRRTEADDAARAAAALDTHIAELEHDLEVSRLRLAELENDLGRTGRQLAGMVTSRSWRVTAPVRSISRALRRRVRGAR